ncbi:hypothetical protein F52700_2462 [Fusarium sp. NRRL 52700]|nr:hypothetical protein F52700_2462 [Fusarium sp. NRRL 52700]
MSDRSAPEKQTARERDSGSGRGNIGPDRNRDASDRIFSMADMLGVGRSQRGHQIGDDPRARLPKPDRVTEAKARRIEHEILMSENNSRPRMPVISRNPANKKPCANCGGQGHKLADCITTVRGYIKACILCDTDSHRTDDCDTFKELSLAEKVKLLVTDRAGKPGLAQWSTLLYEFLEAKETRDIPPPTGFPWTVKFALEVFEGKHGKSVQDIQREFDATHDSKVLPVDTTVRSLPDVWSYYWSIECRPFPLRAHIPRV